MHDPEVHDGLDVAGAEDVLQLLSADVDLSVPSEDSKDVGFALDPLNPGLANIEVEAELDLDLDGSDPIL